MTLNKKCWPQDNETIKSLQYCKVSENSSENAKEWMERLKIAVAECKCKEIDMQSKEQFIHGPIDNRMLLEILHKVTAIKDASVKTSEQV